MKKPTLLHSNVLIYFLVIILSSCEKESVLQAEEEIAIKTPELEPKSLATIQFPNGMKVTFTSQEDGVVYEEHYISESQRHLLKSLRDKSPLARFLTLTTSDVPIPEDLIIIEDDEMILKQAKQRETIVKHTSKLSVASTVTLDQQTRAIESCGGPPATADNSGYGIYFRTFSNYSTDGSKRIVYGSSYGSGTFLVRCKYVSIDLYNCGNAGNTPLVVNSQYKILNTYYTINTILIDAEKPRYWSKTYTLHKYRRVRVDGYSGQRFNGKVLFGNYTAL